MKTASAIFFTVLYTAFSCLALFGVAALNCNSSTCKSAISVCQEIGSITADTNDNNCSHQPAVTAHIIHKQTNNIAGNNYKYVPQNRLIVYQISDSHIQPFSNNKLYPKAVAQTSCPLFIQHCILLI